MDVLQTKLKEMEEQNPSPSLVANRSWSDRFRRVGFNRDVERIEVPEIEVYFSKGGYRERGTENEEQLLLRGQFEKDGTSYEVSTTVNGEIMKTHYPCTKRYGGHDTEIFRVKDDGTPDRFALTYFYRKGKLQAIGNPILGMGGYGFKEWDIPWYDFGSDENILLLSKKDLSSLRPLIKSLEGRTKRKLIDPDKT